MSTQSYRFTHALLKLPSRSILQALRAVDTGAPDYDLFCTHHADYAAALASTGAQVITLPADEAFPDSVFIEDTALCLPQGAIIMRPGAPSRLGEAALIKPTLQALYDEVKSIEGPGYVEGGDILTTQREVLVGLSARTNATGVDELKALTARWGYTLRVVDTPATVLHFKTDCSLLDEESVLCTRRLAATGCFKHYRVIYTADGEEACANAIRFNDLVIMPSGFPRTRDKLTNEGFTVTEIGNSEAAKLDGGMSCLSLRFTPNTSMSR